MWKIPLLEVIHIIPGHGQRNVTFFTGKIIWHGLHKWIPVALQSRRSRFLYAKQEVADVKLH